MSGRSFDDLSDNQRAAVCLEGNGLAQRAWYQPFEERIGRVMG